MDATMMHHPLTTQLILDRGRRLFADSRVIDFDGDSVHARSFAEIGDRAARLAAALGALGLKRGERVGTFAWNSHPQLEAYLAVPAMGCVLHTVNLRLFPEQVAYIIAHAGDRALIVDAALIDLLRPALAGLDTLDHLIVFGGELPHRIAGFAGQIHDYEALIASHAPLTQWPDLDETIAAVACYTSGTTGNPKGVVYSHRSIFLHSLASLAADAFAISEFDRVLMLPPMFHANAWGLPFSGWMAGSDLILPGPNLQPARVARLIELTHPSFTAAVPTILNDLLALDETERCPLAMASFRMMVVGGSAVSRHLIERVREAWGIEIVQGWGMTETSPMGVLSHPPRSADRGDTDRWRAKSGRPVAGVMARIVGDDGCLLADDGTEVGHLQLKGPWIASGYHRAPPGQSPLTADGWLETGDVGTIDPLGYVHVTDRTKDLIKSGGEWISSTDLEREIARWPGVRDVAVIGVPDPRWEERPLALIVPASHEIAPDFVAIQAFLADNVARFMIPEYWGVLTDLPKTSVGKIDKQQLREQVQSGALAYRRIENAR